MVGGWWLVVGGWWLGLGAWGLGLGAWGLGLGAWGLGLGAWGLVLGAWCLVLGAWCLVRATLVLHLTLVLATGVNENDYYAIWTSCCTKAPFMMNSRRHIRSDVLPIGTQTQSKDFRFIICVFIMYVYMCTTDHGRTNYTGISVVSNLYDDDRHSCYSVAVH